VRRESKQDRTDRRRRQVLVWLLGSAKANDEVVKKLAERVSVKESTIHVDLSALKDELENAASDELLTELEQAIQAADTFGALKRLTKRLMSDMLVGRIDRSLGTALVEGVKEQRHVLVRERDEKTQAIMALEILTPEEDALLRAHREKLAPKPLKPGESVPPPTIVEPDAAKAAEIKPVEGESNATKEEGAP
jgi:hypothetical protein